MNLNLLLFYKSVVGVDEGVPGLRGFEGLVGGHGEQGLDPEIALNKSLAPDEDRRSLSFEKVTLVVMGEDVAGRHLPRLHSQLRCPPA